jgi:gliding motility-associated-like protein
VVNLTIGNLPNAGEDGTLVLCAGAPSTALVSGLGGTPQTGGNWSGPTGPSNGTFVPGTNAPGTYTYTVNGVAPCTGTSATASVTVTVNPDPVPAFAYSTSEGCAPLQVQFNLLDATGIQSANWSFGDGGSSNAIGQAFHIYQNGGTYSVQVQVTDLNGCNGSVNVSNAIFASNGPTAFFVPSPLTVSVEDPEFDVAHTPQPGVTYAWSVDGQSIAGGSQFSHMISPAVVGIHPICLVATDVLGCSNELCVDILVDDVLTIYVPNAFTPDGSGINDVFMPSVIGLDPEFYLFTIFDRWGQEIFNTTDPNEGWNGAFRNSGEVLPQGVYVWRLFARDQFSADRKEIVGSVTLLK